MRMAALWQGAGPVVTRTSTAGEEDRRGCGTAAEEDWRCVGARDCRGKRTDDVAGHGTVELDHLGVAPARRRVAQHQGWSGGTRGQCWA
jgi:hypothetical protein